MIDELPQGWCRVSLFDFCRPKQWRTVSAKDLTETGYPVYGANGQIGFFSEYNHEHPTILVTCRGATCGALNVSKPFSWINGNAMALDDLDEQIMLPRYTYHALRKRGFTDVITGSAQPQITRESLGVVEVPLAPLAEQRRIVMKLEKLLEKVDASHRRLSKVPALLKRFRQSILSAAFSGRLTADWRNANPQVKPISTIIEQMRAENETIRVRRGVPSRVPDSDVVADWELPPTWNTYSAAELLRVGAFLDIKDGNHGANHPKVNDFSDTGVPFITAAQVNNYRINYDDAYKLSGEPLKRIRVGFARAGDVIYTHKGSVGRVAIADRDCILTPQTTYYRVSPKVFVNRFVMFYLASDSFSEQVNVVKEQTTRDFVPISEQYLLFHRVPPLREQQEIVRRVDELFTLVDQLQARYAKAKSYIDNLSQSILAKAFRGELVPQDSNDEPASVLLERIREQRNGEPSTKRKRDSIWPKPPPP